MEETRHLHLALRVVAALRNLNGEELGRRAGMSEKQVGKYLREPVNLKINTLTRLLRALDVGYPDFMAVMAELDKLDDQKSLPLFEVAEGSTAGEMLGLPPEMVRVAKEVEWLHHEMQRIVSKLTYTTRTRSFYITDR